MCLIFRKLYPVDQHFFLIKLYDWSKTYRPINLTYQDIPTALSFFGQYQKTRDLIDTTVEQCVESWNTLYGGRPPVSNKKLFFMGVNRKKKRCVIEWKNN